MRNPDPIFYTLPAADLVEGMSTADGQDIVDVDNDGDTVLYHVCTPRHSDTDARMASSPGQRVHLATFKNTKVDGSSYPAAAPSAPAEKEKA